MVAHRKLTKGGEELLCGAIRIAGQPHQELTSSPFLMLMLALPLCIPNSSINCH